MGRIVVTALEPRVALAQWPVLRPLIDEGYAVSGEIMPEDIQDRILGEEILIWIAVDDETAKVHAAMTTELVPMRGGLVCWMGQCSGDRMRDWSDFHVMIEAYAKAEGCVKTVLVGRFGWEKVLKGYRLRTVTLEKDLS